MHTGAHNIFMRLGLVHQSSHQALASSGNSRSPQAWLLRYIHRKLAQLRTHGSPLQDVAFTVMPSDRSAGQPSGTLQYKLYVLSSLPHGSSISTTQQTPKIIQQPQGHPANSRPSIPRSLKPTLLLNFQVHVSPARFPVQPRGPGPFPANRIRPDA